MTNDKKHGFFFVPGDHFNSSTSDSEILGLIRNVRVSKARKEMMAQHEEMIKALFGSSVPRPDKELQHSSQLFISELTAARDLTRAIDVARASSQSEHGVFSKVLLDYYGVNPDNFEAFIGSNFDHAGSHTNELSVVARALLNVAPNGMMFGKHLGYLKDQIKAGIGITSALACFAALELHALSSDLSGGYALAYLQVYAACYFPEQDVFTSTNRINAVRNLLKNLRIPNKNSSGHRSVRATNPMDDVLLQAMMDLVAKFKGNGQFAVRRFVKGTCGVPQMDEFIQYLQKECLEDQHMTNKNTATDAQKGAFAAHAQDIARREDFGFVNWLASHASHEAAKVYGELARNLRPYGFDENTFFGGTNFDEMADIISKIVFGGRATAEAILTVYEMCAHTSGLTEYTNVFKMMTWLAGGLEKSISIHGIQIAQLHIHYKNLVGVNDASYYGVIADATRKMVKLVERRIINGTLSQEGRDVFTYLTGVDANEFQAQHNKGGRVKSTLDDVASSTAPKEQEFMKELMAGVTTTLLFETFYPGNKNRIDWFAANPDSPVTTAYTMLAHQLRGNAEEKSYLGGFTRQEMIDLLTPMFDGSKQHAIATITVFEMNSFTAKKDAYSDVFNLLLRICQDELNPVYLTRQIAAVLSSSFTNLFSANKLGREGEYKKAVDTLYKYIIENYQNGAASISGKGISLFHTLTGVTLGRDDKATQPKEAAQQPQPTATGIKATMTETAVQETPYAAAMKKLACEFILGTIYPENKSLVDRMATYPNGTAMVAYVETANRLRGSRSVESLLGGASVQEMKDMLAANFPSDMVKELPDVLIQVHIMKASIENAGNLTHLFDVLMNICMGEALAASVFSNESIASLRNTYVAITNINNAPNPPSDAAMAYAHAVTKLVNVIKVDCIPAGLSEENEKLFTFITTIPVLRAKAEPATPSESVIALAGEILSKNELAHDLDQALVSVAMDQARLITDDLDLMRANEKKVITALTARTEFPYLGSFVDEMLRADRVGAKEMDLEVMLKAAPVGAVTKSVVTDIVMLRALVKKAYDIKKNEVDAK